MKLNITFLIPLLLIISTVIASLTLYIKHDMETDKTIRENALSHMELDISRLQNILYNLLTRPASEVDNARLNLSVTAMEPSIQSLLLIDDDNTVIMSNHYIWDGKLAEKISGYNIDIAEKVIRHNKAESFFYGKNDSLLAGYYPVVLQLENDNDLPIKHTGILYIEVSIADQLAAAKNETVMLSVSLAAIMLVVTAAIATILHFMISLRLSRLTSAVDKIAWGDLSASVSIGGNDELTIVGDAFNKMANQIREDIWHREDTQYNLLQLNKTLEHRVAERTKELEFKKQELLDSQALAHHANKMAALGEMASGIAHEINSPLQIISILTYKARRSAEKSETVDIAAVTQKIDHATKQITSIVESLRKMSRDSSSDPFEVVKVSDIIEDATEITTERYKLKNIDLQINYHDDCASASLNCQRLQISQIIINLLNNAYDVVQNLTDKWIILEIFETKNNITVKVTDSGGGIHMDNQKQIFEPMFTTKDIGKGTGLGLSISSEIARNHNGTLELDTESEYTRFILTLPKSNIKQKSNKIMEA